VARLSDTSFRATITDGAGSIIRLYYSTKANALADLTSGGTRSGNGTMDVTGVVNGTYWVVAIADNGHGYSLPSNVYEINLSNGTGGTLIAGLGLPRLKAQPEQLDDGLPEQRIRAVYELGQMTLAQANLEEGDFLPANTAEGIAASTWEIVSVKRQRVQGSNAWLASLVARAVRAYEESGP
jgi:hypothetical protein